MILNADDLHASVSDETLDTMNFLNEITHRYPQAISFAPGRPYDGFFETEHVFTYIRRFLAHLAAQGNSCEAVRSTLYQYGPTAGLIRELIADSLRADEDIHVAPEAVVVTSGAQEAMLLTLRTLMTGPRDALLVSSPCYVGIAGAARLLDIPVTAVPEQDGRVSPARLEAEIMAERARGRRPRAFYVIPDHANPSGTTMTLTDREALLQAAARHDVLLLEDSPYRLVSPGPRTATLKSLDHDKNVVHLGSYSKTIFPGARAGFVVADQQVRLADGGIALLAAQIAKVKSMVTVNTSSLSQAAVAGALLVSEGSLADHNADAAVYYGQAMRSVLKHLDQHLPPGRREELRISWNHPAGGFFVALQVAFRADNEALARSAENFGVIWTPMAYFYPEGGGDRAIRLSVSSLTDQEIDEGIARLARFIESESSTR